MRILMLAQFYPPIIGGEERFVRDLSVELVARGHEVVVATLWQKGLKEFEIEKGVRIYRVHSLMERLPFLHSDEGRRHAPSFPDPGVTLALRKIVAAEKPEIVHAFNWMVHSYLPLKAMSKVPLVLSLCDYSFNCVTKKLVYKDAPCSGPSITKCPGCAVEHYGWAIGTVTVTTNQISGWFEKLAVDMFLPVSTAVAIGTGLTSKKLPYRVLPNFVADNIAEAQGDFEQYLAQLPNEPYMMYAGAFGRYKGLDVLFEAYGKLQNIPPLVVIGYDTNESPVQTVNLPENVRVLKNWPNNAVMEAWRRSSIALVPSVWAEPFGIVVLEAMATGRPVIASRIGALSDIVLDGETGLLVTPDSATELSQAIERLVGDPALREQMGQAGRQRLTEFKASSVVPCYEEVYHEMIRR